MLLDVKHRQGNPHQEGHVNRLVNTRAGGAIEPGAASYLGRGRARFAHVRGLHAAATSGQVFNHGSERDGGPCSHSSGADCRCLWCGHQHIPDGCTQPAGGRCTQQLSFDRAGNRCRPQTGHSPYADRLGASNGGLCPDRIHRRRGPQPLRLRYPDHASTCC